MIPTKRRSLLLGVAVIGALAGAAAACDIPVFKYALLSWDRNPYYAVYFHDGKAAPEDAAANAALVERSSKASNLNLVFSVVDVTHMADLPEDAVERAIWMQNPQRKLPVHVIYTPVGYELFSGRLGVEDVRSLGESAAMAGMIETLKKGEEAVLLLLLGADESANEQARKVVDAAVAEAAEVQEPIAVAALRRDDPKEKWLVRQLLTVEKDLRERPEPMVFGIFGRGRVLEPCIGKGIDEVNMRYLIGAFNGPCTCTIQGGFGIDMLTNIDWNEALPEGAYMYEGFDDEEYEETPVRFEDESPTPGPDLTAQPAPAPRAGPSPRVAAGSPGPRPVAAGGVSWVVVLGLVGAAGALVLGILAVGVVLVVARQRRQA